MKDRSHARIVLGALAALLVAGCGGGGGGGDGAGGNNDTSGIDRGGIYLAQGPINGFGSVIVNGIRYSTGGAVITIDGRPGSESELKVGQVVRIEATLDASGTTGTAKTITFDDDVEGPVQSIDRAASRLVVLGQTIQVSAATSFGDSIVPRGGFFWFISVMLIYLYDRLFPETRSRWLKLLLSPLQLLAALIFLVLLPQIFYVLDRSDTRRDITLGYACIARANGSD